MRLGWAAVPLLIAVPGCSPVRDYQAAARSLRVTLDRVEPNLQLALPLDQSRITLKLTLGVENPSSVAFHLRSFQGAVRLETADGAQPLGRLEMLRALDLPAGGKADLALALSFTYRDLADRWPTLQAAIQGQQAGAWVLEGTLRGDVHGIPVQLPVRTRRSFGGAP